MADIIVNLPSAVEVDVTAVTTTGSGLLSTDGTVLKKVDPLSLPTTTVVQNSLDTLAQEISDHEVDANNPHNVTKAQVGLNSVDDVKQYPNSNPNGYETPSQLTTRDTNNRSRTNHTGTQAISTVTGLQTALDNKEPNVSLGTTSQYYRGDKSFQTLDKSAVGLGNVNNTTDANKPVSTAQQTALNLKANLASPTFTGTVTLPSGQVINGVILETGGSPTLYLNQEGNYVSVSSGGLTFSQMYSLSTLNL